MASAFAHALAAITLGKTFPKHFTSAKFLILGAVCSVLPDADVIMFAFGVPYEHMMGHRGFSHSLVFALLLGVAVTAVFYRNIKLLSFTGLAYIFYFFIATVSHALLDAMTTGGLGVAIFAPFDNTRYFLPWRPIQVSPIGIKNFFSSWGLRVIKSEMLWVGVPCIVYVSGLALFRRFNRPQKAVKQLN
jgi:inner membrane protein